MSKLGLLNGHLDAASHGALLPTGWPEVDAALEGGLPAGALHEWFGLSSDRSAEESPRAWCPALGVLIHFAWRALEADALSRSVAWIGRRCFPYPSVLVRDRGRDFRLFERSLFVSARDADSRLWAMDLALRCPAVGVVIADGSAFSMAATRRVQLLAKQHETLALTVRPPRERNMLSAAQSRWLVGWEPHSPVSARRFVSVEPRWSVRLLRCKGVRSDQAHDVWVLEWDHATSTLRLPSEVAHPARDSGEESTYRRAEETSRTA